MVPQQLLDKVATDVLRHCRESKGYDDSPGVNALVPVDSVDAFAMAKSLTAENAYDYCVSVTPEGHVYGYFFEKFGATVLSVYVDYPPTRCEVLDDLSVLQDQRVLILEDDVISGITLRFTIDALMAHDPTSLALFLGRSKEFNLLENVGPEINKIHMAEDYLDSEQRNDYETEFIDYFGTLFDSTGA